jgi:hypothetical protein
MFMRYLLRYISRPARVAIVLILFAGALKYASAQEPAISALSFSRGEELVYQAEFTRGLLRGIDVAEFRFKANIEPPSPNGGSNHEAPTIILVGDVASKGLFVRVAGFHFHQHVESTVDPRPFVVLRTSKLYEQGKRERISEAVFNHSTHQVTWTERDSNESTPATATTVDFSEPIQDVLTIIYFLRTQHLEVGKSLDIPLTDSGRIFRMSVAVVERKRINTVLGHVNTFRVEPAMFGAENLSRSRGQLSIWITDDDRHLPVKAQLKVELGTFDIKLKKVRFPEVR